MLARTPQSLVYLSADELGITEQAMNALLWVRGRLEQNVIRHSRTFFPIGHNNFNMEYWEVDAICGTAHCIGGWMEARGSGVSSKDGGPLRPLFYPRIKRSEWKRLTSAQAVRAIDEFLRGAGDNCWPNALTVLDEPAWPSPTGRYGFRFGEAETMSL